MTSCPDTALYARYVLGSRSSGASSGRWTSSTPSSSTPRMHRAVTDAAVWAATLRGHPLHRRPPPHRQ
eukprot:6410894-Heterocapsa_arctica.AAC.1